MADNLEGTAPQMKDKFGCSAVSSQDVNVCIPVTVKAFGAE